MDRSQSQEIRRMMVKQHVGVVRGQWSDFRVFETGDPKFYLFCQMDPNGCDTGLHIPTRKTELQPEAKRALARGCSYTVPSRRAQ